MSFLQHDTIIGSTGRPKFVRGTHRGLINRLAWQTRVFPWITGSPDFFNSQEVEAEGGEDSISKKGLDSLSNMPDAEEEGLASSSDVSHRGNVKEIVDPLQEIDGDSNRENEEVEQTQASKQEEKVQEQEQQQQAEEKGEKEEAEAEGEEEQEQEDNEEEQQDIVFRRTPLTFVDALVEIFGPLVAEVPVKLWVPDPLLLREGFIHTST